MNNTELANFKKKLSIELETTTNDEAQLISNIVDSAAGGGGGGAGVAGYILHPVEVELSPIKAKMQGEGLVTINGYTSEGLTDTSIFASDTNAYVLMIYSETEEMNIYVDGYFAIESGDIDPTTIPSDEYYLEGGVTVLLAFNGEQMYSIIPSADVIHPGTGAPK